MKVIRGGGGGGSGLGLSEKSDNVSLSYPNIVMWGAGCPNLISLVRAGLPESFEKDSVILEEGG